VPEDVKGAIGVKPAGSLRAHRPFPQGLSVEVRPVVEEQHAIAAEMPKVLERLLQPQRHLHFAHAPVFRERDLPAPLALRDDENLTAEAVTRVERGVRMPTLKTLGKIAFGLGVSPAQLVDAQEGLPVTKLSGHVARIVSKLEDEDDAVQKGAAEIVVAYLRAVGRSSADRPGRKPR
jgi:hypothetical protein